MKHPYSTTATFVVLTLLLSACQNNDDDTNATDMASGDTTSSNEVPASDEVAPAADTPQITTVANPLVDTSEVDARVNAFLTANPVAGMSVAIVRADAEPLLWSGNYGMRDIESAAPVDDETSFWLGSTSKMVMGTTMMIAREKGFLDLDDNVQALLAANGNFSIDNPSLRPISLTQLAAHTSGIIDAEEAYGCAYYYLGPDGEALREFLGPDGESLNEDNCPEQSPVDLEGFLGAYLDLDGVLYDIDENFSTTVPGEQFEYSNIGAGLAGHVIGLTTGQDLATFASQEIFSPLGMQHTSWRSADFDQQNIATPYAELDDALLPLPKFELATWPDGGLRSNAGDLATLLVTLMQDRRSEGSDTTLLQADSIETLLPVGDAEYGLFVQGGIELTYAGDNHRIVGHTGSDPGAFSFMLFDPETDIGVIVTGNGDDDGFDEETYFQLIAFLFESGAAMQAAIQ